MTSPELFGYEYVTIAQALERGMKFDVIVGNPPYEDPNNDGVKIYRDFIKASMNLISATGHIALVTPNTWLTYGDALVAEVLLKHDIEYMDVRSKYIKTTHFPSVGSTFCWYVLGPKQQDSRSTIKGYGGEITYDSQTRQMVPVENSTSKVSIPINETSMSILDKFMQYQGDTLPVRFVTTRGVGTRTSHKPERSDTHNIPCYCSTVEDHHLHYIEDQVPHHDLPKVFFVSSYFHNDAVRRSRFCPNPVSNMNNIAYGVITDMSHGPIIEGFCNSKFLKFVINMMTSKRDIPIGIIKGIQVPTNGVSSYGLSPDELKLIEDTIPSQHKD